MVIVASGPNRIGQGLEFDTCCTLASLAFRRLGRKTIMVNSNPETVSTDFNISDRLYISPLTAEEVIGIMEKEGTRDVVVQLGGQTPLNMADELLGSQHHRNPAGGNRRHRRPRSFLRTGQEARTAPAAQPHGRNARGGFRVLA